MQFQLAFSTVLRWVLSFPGKRVFILGFHFPFYVSYLKHILKTDQTPVAFSDHSWFSRDQLPRDTGQFYAMNNETKVGNKKRTETWALATTLSNSTVTIL